MTFFSAGQYNRLMRKVKSLILSQLFMETRFAPRSRQKKQLSSAEELYKIAESGRQYPFEFVCFKITGYRPKNSPANTSVSGAELRESLPAFIFKASARIGLRVDEEAEKIYSIGQLAAKFSVSGRTIERWRKRGLLARKYLFADGVTRTGFAQRQVEEFVSQNSRLIEQAAGFSNLTRKDKQQIIKDIISIAAGTNRSRRQIIIAAAEHSGRSAETIRCLLLDFEKRNPKKNIFKKPHIVIGTKERAIVFNMFEAGASVDELAKKFQRSKSSIYRIISRRRIRRLLSSKTEYIESSEFSEEGARQKILGKSLSLPGVLRGKRIDLRPQGPRYFELIKKVPALNRQQEMELFRRYNFLKYLVKKAKAGLDLARPSGRDVRAAQQLLSEAEEAKGVIITANLRLVARIAGRHSGGANCGDLISQGNIALMRAVEKFDYTRGFRFSTYASWVISKDFARHFHTQSWQNNRPAGGRIDQMQSLAGKPIFLDAEDIESAHHSLEKIIADNLTEREQYIIRYHFGLVGTLVKKKSKTLKQIGDELGLSKERIRQIELVALQKLRQSLSAEEFSLLTG